MAKILGINVPKPEQIKNQLINGGMHIWQRGTTIALAANTYIYSADRWGVISVTSTAVVTQVAATTGVPGFGLKMRRNLNQTGTGFIALTQDMESVNSIPLTSKTVTLSFRAKAGADFSSASKILSSRISTGTGTDKKRIVEPTGAIDFIQSNTLTTSFQTFTHTVTLGAGINQVSVFFLYDPTGTAGADDSFTIESVMLNEGAAVAPFRLFGNDIGGELLACQRYYEKSYNSSANPGATGQTGRRNAFTSAAGEMREVVCFVVRKRAIPSCVAYSPTTGTPNTIRDSNGSADRSASTAEQTETTFLIAASSITASSVAVYEYTADAEL